MDNKNESSLECINYFSSYEDLEIHRLMIEDSPRTSTYKKAIFDNQSFFKDKIVMDVGCGTGILSLFCAQAGAAKVYAVEASNLALMAKEIVKENKFEDIIEVIHSKVEDVILPSNLKVDIIISEWMGFYLLHEGMLDSVFIARDKFLKENGTMFPESATIFVAPCSVPSMYKQWKNVHGVSMTTFAKYLRQSKQNKPEIMVVQPEDLMGEEIPMCWIDLKHDNISSLDSFSVQHVVVANKEGPYQGISIWFKCNFPKLNGNNGSPVVLDTSPFESPTHWKQTVVIFPEEQLVDECEPIAFNVNMKRDAANNRRYTLEVSLLDPEEIEHPLPCSCYTTNCILIKTYMLHFPEKGSGGTNSGILDDDDCVAISDDEN